MKKLLITLPLLLALSPVSADLITLLPELSYNRSNAESFILVPRPDMAEYDIRSDTDQIQASPLEATPLR